MEESVNSRQKLLIFRSLKKILTVKNGNETEIFGFFHEKHIIHFNLSQFSFVKLIKSFSSLKPFN